MAAVAKAFSLFSLKTEGVKPSATAEQKPPVKLEQIHVEVVTTAPEGGGEGRKLSEADVKFLQTLADSIRNYARLVDTPSNILHSEKFLEEAEAAVGALGVPIEKTVIKVKHITQSIMIYPGSNA